MLKYAILDNVVTIGINMKIKYIVFFAVFHFCFESGVILASPPKTTFYVV